MKNEVFCVIQKRRDGRLPDPVKMMYVEGQQGLHYTFEDAVTARDAVNASLGGNFAGVFRCELEVIEECQP